jgi:lycopene beta-cyclase
MSNILDIDLAILGGGCAGLSLAKYLSYIEGYKKKTLVIEARLEYTNDRSWCFWEPQDQHLLKDLNGLISHRWPQWQFSGNQFKITHHGKGRHYCYIPSDRFYQQAVDCISRHPRMALKCGISVVSVNSESNGYLIKLSDGTHIVAKQIIDTRPCSYTTNAQSKLWQIFYGVEIQADTPIFDPTCVGLMEHLASSPTGTQFIYILPFSTQHALIECTVFSPQLHSPQLMAPCLHEWLQAQYHQTHFKIIRTEQGVLPMGLKTATLTHTVTPKYTYGGQVAGAIRPATGYGFLRIQRWAHACALQIAQEKVVHTPVLSKKIVQAMDHIFLNVLHNEPQIGALLFQALAQRVPPRDLVRFLSDEAQYLDYVSIMHALPLKLFLRYCLKIGKSRCKSN